MNGSLKLSQNEIIDDILALMQIKSKYTVWLPSHNLTSSIKDLLFSRVGLDVERVAAFMTKFEEQAGELAELWGLAIDGITKTFGLSKEEATNFIDGVFYLNVSQQLQKLTDAELVQRRSQAIHNLVHDQ